MELETILDATATEIVLTGYPGRVGKAIVRALNRGIQSARAAGVPEIARDMKLKSGDVREAIRLQLATPDRHEAKLLAPLKRLALVKFGARQTRRGVSADTGRGRRVYAGTFLATMRSGHTGVFQRVSPSRSRAGLPSPSSALPIAEKFGPSIGRVFRKYRVTMLTAGQESVEKNLAHELKYQASLAEAGGDAE